MLKGTYDAYPDFLSPNCLLGVRHSFVTHTALSHSSPMHAYSLLSMGAWFEFKLSPADHLYPISQQHTFIGSLSSDCFLLSQVFFLVSILAHSC